MTVPRTEHTVIAIPGPRRKPFIPKSVVAGPYYIDGSDAFVAGAVESDAFCAGASASDMYSAGAVVSAEAK
jgi:hypothetical protein